MSQRRANIGKPSDRNDINLHFKNPAEIYSHQLSDVKWKTSSRCAGNGSCVEVAQLSMGHMAVRDGMNPHMDEVMILTQDKWKVFLAGIREGEVGAG
jgi:Domain of unknown function (DUF397)